MLHALLLCTSVVAGVEPAPSPSPDAREAYKTASTKVGRDPEKHVQLALWCEAQGLSAERWKHLAQAVLIDPDNAMARGLLGLVRFGGRWQRPDVVSTKLQEDTEHTAKFAEYAQRRARTAYSADAQWKLALWCEENGLKAESLAHLSAVLRLHSNHDGARKRLGFKKHGQRWLTDEQLAAEHADAEAQRRADKHWKPLLAKWRDALSDKTTSEPKRDAAEEALAQVTDPRAVPAAWEVLACHKAQAAQVKAVQVFGQIDGPRASQALATLAIAGPSPAVRQLATETLRSRDPRDYLGLLIRMVRDPVKFKVVPGTTPGQVGELFVEGKRVNTRRIYQVNQNVVNRIAAMIPARLYAPNIPFDPYSPLNLSAANEPMYVPYGGQLSPSQPPGMGAAGNNMAVLNTEAVAARRDLQIAAGLNAIQQTANQVQQQMAADVSTLEALNADIHRVNDAALPILNVVTGQDLGESQDAWQNWWSDQRGLVYDTSAPLAKPIVTEIITNPEPPPPPHTACFGSGTPIRTLDGPKAIETIRAGDQVLTQDVHTGTLSFQPVLAIFHNKPAATLKLTIGEETIVVTGIHRFWKAGHGWVMARELKPGDPIRTLGGIVKVAKVASFAVLPVFNLEVASSQSYFVGTQGTLVHDNSLVQPEREPFDASPSVAQLATARQ